jgi:tyrosyl-tRNA synthetase
MASKMSLARRLVADFHGAEAAAAAEAEWRRVHQDHQTPSDMPAVSVPAGSYRPHELLARAGLTRSNSEGVRLLRQGAVRRDGAPVEPGAELTLAPGGSLVLSIGPARFVRVEATDKKGTPDP